MLPLQLHAPVGEVLSVLVIGAHPDDIEIGAGGLLLGLAASRPRVRYMVLTGTAERHAEAQAAASAFLPGAELTVSLHDLPDGRLPAVWDRAKDILQGVARSFAPDLVVAPSATDASPRWPRAHAGPAGSRCPSHPAAARARAAPRAGAAVTPPA